MPKFRHRIKEGKLKSNRRFLSHSHAASDGQEKRVAKRVGGSQVKGSGCGFEVGDVRNKEKAIRVECKSTIRNSFSVTQKMLDKIEDAAVLAGELPAIHIEFLDADTGEVLREVAVVPAYVLDSLCNE